MAIHIKKSHEGLLTAKAKRAGEGVQEFARSHLKSGDEETRAQAQFAVNAKKWHHPKKKHFGLAKAPGE